MARGAASGPAIGLKPELLGGEGNDYGRLRPRGSAARSLSSAVYPCADVFVTIARDVVVFVSGLREPRNIYRRAAEQGDELAPSHSITSSARASSVGGM